MITIRHATAKDVPRMCFEAEPVNEPVSRRQFAEWLAKDGYAALVVIDERDRMIGQVFYTIAGGPAERTLYFFLLHVVQVHRGRGIGAQLVAAVEEIALAQRCIGLTLGVDVENQRARSLYERLGYAAFGERPYTIAHTSIGRTETLMCRYLACDVAA